MFKPSETLSQVLKKRKKLLDGIPKKKKIKPEKRRKSITVHHQPDGATATMMDLTTGNEP
jgi:hypothetical protein